MTQTARATSQTPQKLSVIQRRPIPPAEGSALNVDGRKAHQDSGRATEMSTPTPEAVAEYIAVVIAGDHHTPYVDGPVDDIHIEGRADLVEVAKALMQRFVITERPTE